MKHLFYLVFVLFITTTLFAQQKMQEVYSSNKFNPQKKFIEKNYKIAECMY